MSNYLDRLPDDATGVVVVLSGGLDSTIAMRLCVEKYGAERVHAVTFDYGQRQRIEIEKASESTARLGVTHKIFDLSVLNQINQGFSANVDTNISMPTIYDVLGDPQPTTYIANRNMILMALCASYAETQKLSLIVMGLQSTDLYGYHDTAASFVQCINDALTQNRTFKIKVVAPFNDLTKQTELEILLSLDNNLTLLKHTLTCYNPDVNGLSCGVCPSCSERLKAFSNIGQIDPISYQRE